MATDTEARNTVDRLAARVDRLEGRINTLSEAINRLAVLGAPPLFHAHGPSEAELRRRQESEIARRREDAEAAGKSLTYLLLTSPDYFLTKMNRWACEAGRDRFAATKYILVDPTVFDAYESLLSPVNKMRDPARHLAWDTLQFQQWILVRNGFGGTAEWVRSGK